MENIFSILTDICVHKNTNIKSNESENGRMVAKVQSISQIENRSKFPEVRNKSLLQWYLCQLYRVKIETLCTKLMMKLKNVPKTGITFLKECYQITKEMKKVIFISGNFFNALNEYLETFGNNLLDEDHPLRKTSNLHSECLYILRKVLLKNHQVVIAREMMECIEEMRSGEKNDDDMIEEMFHLFHAIDLGSHVKIVIERLGKIAYFRFVKTKIDKNGKRIDEQLIELKNEEEFPPSTLIELLSGTEDNVEMRTNNFYKKFRTMHMNKSTMEYLRVAVPALEREQMIISRCFINQVLISSIINTVADIVIAKQYQRLVEGLPNGNQDDPEDGLVNLMTQTLTDSSESIVYFKKLYDFTDNLKNRNKYWYNPDYTFDYSIWLVQQNEFVRKHMNNVLAQQATQSVVHDTGNVPEATSTKKRRRGDDDDGGNKKKGRRGDEEEAPKKRRRGDEEEAPKKRRRGDDEEAPKKRRRGDDDEGEKKKTRHRGDDDGGEEKKTTRRRGNDDGEKKEEAHAHAERKRPRRQKEPTVLDTAKFYVLKNKECVDHLNKINQECFNNDTVTLDSMKNQIRDEIDKKFSNFSYYLI